MKNITMINQRDENGLKHGLWKEYHFNGQLRSRGKFNKGRPNGRWEFYQDDGSIKYIRCFINGERNGVWEEHYSLNGGVYFRGLNKKNKQIGLWYERRYDY